MSEKERVYYCDWKDCGVEGKGFKRVTIGGMYFLKSHILGYSEKKDLCEKHVEELRELLNI